MPVKRSPLSSLPRHEAARNLTAVAAGVALCMGGGAAWAQNIPPADAATVAPDGWVQVYPQVLVNGAPNAGLPKFMTKDGVLYADPGTLHALGIRPPKGTFGKARWAGETMPADAEPEPGDGAPAAAPTAAARAPHLFDLATLPGLQVQYDAARQTLNLTAPLDWLQLATTEVGKRTDQPYAIAKPGFAAVLNYDANVMRDKAGNRSQGLMAEARLTTPWGYLNQTQFWHHATHAQGMGTRSAARLDTFWRSTWPQHGLGLTLGDTMTSQLGGMGGSHIGGFRLEKTYAMQPWVSTVPLASYVGQTTLPSTVDLYLNGVRQYSQQVPAGPYQLTLPPGISGSGAAQVVATDVLGRTVVVNMPLYGGTGLLAKGLSEWSLEAGYLRKDYGIRSNAYDRQPVFSGTLRYGVTNYLTMQVHGEGARGYRQMGAAANIVLGALGQLNLAHSQSRLQAKRGRQDSASFSTQRGRISFGLGWSRSDDAWASLGNTLQPSTFAPQGVQTRIGSASVGWSHDMLGSVSVSYLHSRRGLEAPDKLATLTWSRNIGRRTNVFVGATRSFGAVRQNSIYAGISVSLDQGYSVSLNGNRNSDGATSYQAQLSKSSSGLGSPSWSLGWQQQTNADGSRHHNGTGSVQYASQYGDGWANAYANNNGANTFNAGWRGGLVWMDGGLFATRTVNDSFAVVSTSGVPGVPVLASNNRAGVTNRQGLLLVPSLMAYQKNTLSIDTLNLPVDMQIERSRAEVAPAERSGTSVRFGLRRVLSGVFVLKDAYGALLPVGSSISNAQGQPVAVVGFDGKTYIENLEPGANTFTVALPDSGASCTVRVQYPTQRDAQGLVNLGELRCQ